MRSGCCVAGGSLEAENIACHLDAVVGEHGGEVVVVVACGGSVQAMVGKRFFDLCAVC